MLPDIIDGNYVRMVSQPSHCLCFAGDAFTRGIIQLFRFYQGKGDIPTASRTYVGPDSTIKADATENGDGGKVIVWSDEITGFYGDISARGGAEGGNGGFVEVSGKDTLIFSEGQDHVCKKAENCKMIKFPDSFHEILQEKDSIRDRALKEIFNFLK